MGCMKEMGEQETFCSNCGFDERSPQPPYAIRPGSIIEGRYVVGKSLEYNGNIVTYIGLDASRNQRILVEEYMPQRLCTRNNGEEELTVFSGDAYAKFQKGLEEFLNRPATPDELNRMSVNSTGYRIIPYRKLEPKPVRPMPEPESEPSQGGNTHSSRNIAIALIALVLVAGIGIGAWLWLGRGNDSSVDQGGETSVSAKVIDLTKAASLEEAEKMAEDAHVNLETHIVFEADAGGERIVSQTISPGTPVSAVSGEAVGEDGRITIGITVLTSERASYRILRNWVASQYETLNSSIEIQEAKKDPKKNPYGTVDSIELSNGDKITANELENKKNKNKYVRIDDIKTVYQYTGDIYWIETMDDYVGTYVDDVRFKVTHVAEDNSDTVRDNKRGELLRFEDNYYSLSPSYRPGYIVEQMVKKGKRYSSAENAGALFHTIGETISYSSQDSASLLSKLRSLDGVNVAVVGSGEIIQGITIDHKSPLSVKGSDVIFKAGDTITVSLEPKPTPAPQQQDQRPPQGNNNQNNPTPEPKSDGGGGGSDDGGGSDVGGGGA